MRYLAAAILISVIGYVGLLNPVRDNYTQFVSPIQFGLRKGALTIKDAVDFFGHIGAVRNENLELSQRVLNLESTIVELKQVQDENQLLRDQLNVTSKDLLDRDLVFANVMGNPTDTTGATLYINRGSNDGIREGDNVIQGNFLVGIIRTVTPERSLVELITSPNVSATVLDIDVSSKTEGLASGQYGSFILLQRVLPNEALNLGDSIVTSGKDGFFYPGLYLGKISDISQDPAQPLKTAVIEVMVDLSRIKKVFVLKMD